MKLARILGAVLLTSIVVGCTSTSVLPPTPPIQTRFQVLDDAAPAQERYYLLVFASQSTPKVPRYTHTWATAVRVRDQGPNRHPVIESQTISWLPASRRVHLWDLRVETGVNLDLRRTLEEMRGQGQKVSLWGPYEIDPDLYRHVLAQKAFLESGRVGYQALDDVGEAGIIGNGTNCIHAVAECDERFGYPFWICGEATGEFMVEHLAEQGALINPNRSHDWVIPVLGLTDYPIIRHGPP
jgi:hypothetical protein